MALRPTIRAFRINPLTFETCVANVVLECAPFHLRIRSYFPRAAFLILAVLRFPGQAAHGREEPLSAQRTFAKFFGTLRRLLSYSDKRPLWAKNEPIFYEEPSTCSC